ncbi:MAG TPA: DNA mismatch endonuclease Vsr [Terracidiphilus sp.]|nr:DNA mismatch endonuclease Vsr [Terracidiphilus sp.]
MDTLTKVERSICMSRIRSKDTKPELAVRRLVHGMGYRYRLHSKNLPGKPDMVFSGRSKVIFVHGCFWHFHRNCPDGRMPKSRVDYWKPKLQRNIDRDRQSTQRLHRLGWSSLVVWECELANQSRLAGKIRLFLG